MSALVGEVSFDQIDKRKMPRYIPRRFFDEEETDNMRPAGMSWI